MARRGGGESRMRELRAAHEAVQKKSFTRWLNLHLRERELKVDELYEDLKTGLVLNELMSKLSGEDLPKPARPRMRVHMMENVDKVLRFIQSRGVRLESIGSGDVVDSKNHTLILGLIWTIILRFEITGIEIEGSDAKSAKEALLIWCQRNTAGYANVNVKNFSSSWQSGLGFCALINKFCPHLLSFKDLDPSDYHRNLETAFMVADKDLGIGRLLDVEDVAEMPEEKSIMTYLYMYYNKFNAMKDDDLWKRRLATVLAFEVEMEGEQAELGASIADLLKWCRKKCGDLSLRNFPQEVEGVQSLLGQFKRYRTAEKPPRFVQKGGIDAKLFAIQAARRRAERPLHVMAAGQDLMTLNKAWSQLEHEEHEREVALFEQLSHLQRLNRLADKFESKAKMRTTWLEQTTDTISTEEMGNDVWAVRAAEHRSGSILTSIKGYEDRFYGLTSLGQQLVDLGYSKSAAVEARSEAISKQWLDTNVAADLHASKVSELYELHKVLEIINTAVAEAKEKSSAMESEVTGKSLPEAEELTKVCDQISTAISTTLETTKMAVDKALDEFIEKAHPLLPELEEARAEMVLVFENFDLLALKRKMLLAEALEYQQFCEDASNEQAWIKEHEPLASSQDLGTNITSVVGLQKKHKALLVDLGVRQKSGVEPVVVTGKRLVTERNHEAEEISRVTKHLQENWKELKTNAAQREAALERAGLIEQYVVDANEVESWLAVRESLTGRDDLGKDEHNALQLQKSVQTVQTELEGYGTVIKGLRAQCEEAASVKIVTIKSRPGSRRASLIEEEPAVRMVKARYDYEARRDKELTIKKGDLLRLVSDKDANWWKVGTLTADPRTGYVPAKYVKLQKPETSESVELTTDNKSDELRERQASIETRFSTLCDVATKRNTRLLEAVQYHQFVREATEVEDWMADKETVARSTEVGGNVREVEASKAAFDRFRNELESSQSLVDSINSLAATLVAEGHSDAASVSGRRDNINARWEVLRELAKSRTEVLDRAFAVETSNHDLGKATTWVRERAAAMPSDLGRDVSSVQALQRQHDQLLRDLEALETQLAASMAQSIELQKQYPDETATLAAQRAAAEEAMTALKEAAVAREKRLAEALKLQEFMRDFRAEESWINQMSVELETMPLAEDVGRADMVLSRHSDMRHEIDARKKLFEAVAHAGATMVTDEHYESSSVASTCADLVAKVASLDQLWGDRLLELTECHSLRRFESDVANLNAWMDSQENFLANTDRGESLVSVQQLLRSFQDFSQRLETRCVDIDAAVTKSVELASTGHYASANIKAVGEKLRARADALLDLNAARGAALKNAEEFQFFLRDAEELRVFIDEKSQTAADKCYEDGTNLKSKIKAHEDFVAELGAHESVLEAVVKQQADMMARKHYASAQAEAVTDDLVGAWDDLQAATTDRGIKLNEANNQQDFERSVHDLASWCDLMDVVLRVDDMGDDLGAAKSLLKRQEQLVADFEARKRDVDDMSSNAQELIAAGNHRADDIAARQTEIESRYEALREPLTKRRAALKDSVVLQRFLHDADVEMAWMAERQARTDLDEVGEGLQEAIMVLKTHRLLDAEINAHAPLVQSVVKTGSDVVKDGHYEAKIISDKADELSAALARLQEASSKRLTKLVEAESAERLFTTLGEAHAWIDEVAPLTASEDFGADFSSTESHLSRHHHHHESIEAHGLLVAAAVEDGQRTIRDRHFMAPIIRTRIDEVIERQRELEAAAGKRQHRLSERLRLHLFQQEYEEAMFWIADRTAFAESNDNGKDQDDCVALTERVQDAWSKVQASEHDRVTQLLEKGRRYVLDSHADAAIINESCQTLDAAWASLGKAFTARRAALRDALEVHAYNFRVEDALSRIAAAKALVSSADVGRDVSTTEVLQRSYADTQPTIDALETEVETLKKSADELCARITVLSGTIEKKDLALHGAWKDLEKAGTARRSALSDANALHVFRAKFQHLHDWLDKFLREMESSATFADSSIALQNHLVFKGELDARQPTFEALYAMGGEVIMRGGEAVGSVKEDIELLKNLVAKLRETWAQLKIDLEHRVDSDRFLARSHELQKWIEKTHRQISNMPSPDYSDPMYMARLEQLIKQQEELEQALHAYENKVHVMHELTDREKAMMGDEEVRRYNMARQEQIRRVQLDNEQRVHEARQSDEARVRRFAKLEAERRAREDALARERELSLKEESSRRREQRKAAAEQKRKALEQKKQSQQKALQRAIAEAEARKQANARAQERHRGAMSGVMAGVVRQGLLTDVARAGR